MNMVLRKPSHGTLLTMLNNQTPTMNNKRLLNIIALLSIPITVFIIWIARSVLVPQEFRTINNRTPIDPCNISNTTDTPCLIIIETNIIDSTASREELLNRAEQEIEKMELDKDNYQIFIDNSQVIIFLHTPYGKEIETGSELAERYPDLITGFNLSSRPADHSD